MPPDTGEVVNTGLVITPASREVLAAQANAAHEAVKELMGTAAREGQRRGVSPHRVADPGAIRLNASR